MLWISARQVHFSHAQQVSIGFLLGREKSVGLLQLVRKAGKVVSLISSVLWDSEQRSRDDTRGMTTTDCRPRDDKMCASWNQFRVESASPTSETGGGRGGFPTGIQRLGFFYLFDLLDRLARSHNERVKTSFVGPCHQRSCNEVRGDPENTLEMLDKDSFNRPVLKHGPRSLTYMRVLW